MIEIDVIESDTQFGCDIRVIERFGDYDNVLLLDGMQKVCRSPVTKLPVTCHLNRPELSTLWDRLGELGYGHRPAKKSTPSLPAADFKPVNFRDQTCTIGKHWYNVTTLIDCAKGLPVHESCADVFNISYGTWRDLVSINDFRNHMARTLNADLSYPVILSPEGEVMDGMHRIVKALITGEPVKWVKLTELPKPDGVNEDED